MGEWSEECDVCSWHDGFDGPTVGAIFDGHNRNGDHEWTTQGKVVEATPGRAFAFECSMYSASTTRPGGTASSRSTAAAGSRSGATTCDRRQPWSSAGSYRGSTTGRPGTAVRCASPSTAWRPSSSADLVPRFVQQTRLVATSGNADALRSEVPRRRRDPTRQSGLRAHDRRPVDVRRGRRLPHRSVVERGRVGTGPAPRRRDRLGRRNAAARRRSTSRASRSTRSTARASG